MEDQQSEECEGMCARTVQVKKWNRLSHWLREILNGGLVWMPTYRTGNIWLITHGEQDVNTQGPCALFKLAIEYAEPVVGVISVMGFMGAGSNNRNQWWWSWWCTYMEPDKGPILSARTFARCSGKQQYVPRICSGPLVQAYQKSCLPWRAY